MFTMTDDTRPGMSDPFVILHEAAQAIAALRPMFRFFDVPLTSVAITDLRDGGTVVIRTSPDAAHAIADQLDLNDRVQVHTNNCWVLGFEGPVALIAEHRLRVVATSDAPCDDCRPLRLHEADRIGRLFSAVAL